MAYFQHVARDASPKGYGRLRSITIRLVITSCSGEVYFTDIMLLPLPQDGAVMSNEIKWTLYGRFQVDLFIEKWYIILGSIAQSVRVRYVFLG
ncbi:hypothetical protein MNQ98_14655 [Paenibacillus sp. N3/727]|uniref:hypothetical protein n=1 Tax=Paenibacillus sp. N3/727 TaxID=2925845 RepID=UPI001F53DBDB|nr:hypothetical protein [Paenibacillus sp. N3/727]UNK15809.1 hypothetical protein MNQ98_14655 [Paenibacillus sp. N3/727]